MQITRYEAPFDSKDILAILAEEFGAEEAALERPQFDGSETQYNTDIAYIAREGDTLLGCIHATIPRHFPKIAGLSAMVTKATARGTGLGKRLFGDIVNDLDSMNVETIFLGTNNPIAHKLYSKFGFAYTFGSCIMMRTVLGAPIDLQNSLYKAHPGNIVIRPGSPEMRIPIIPLILNRGSCILLDANAGIADCALLTQTSCMGLYQKYRNILSDGGKFFCAYSDSGILGAVASVKPTDVGNRCDFFSAPGFESALEPLVEECRKAIGKVYFQLAEGDPKLKYAEQWNLKEFSRSFYDCRGIKIPTVNFE